MSRLVETDVIRDLLSAYPPTAQVFPRRAYCGSWNLSTSGSRKCAFHLVESGTCWLHLQHGSPLQLGAGDLAMFPRDAWHNLCGSPTPALAVGESPDGSGVSITCGHLEFSDARANPILEALPDIVVVRAREETERKRIADLIDLLGAEAGTRRAGESIVLDKLAEVLFAMVLRAHMESSGEKRGVLAALADARLGRALGAIHREPDRDWQLGSLAAEAGMSRSAFCARFSEVVGAPPMHYLGEWRMRRAETLLRDRRNSVYSIAAQLGYRTEAAFRRAFKRSTGRAPGEIRRAATARQRRSGAALA